jgi:hypothetical protein
MRGIVLGIAVAMMAVTGIAEAQQVQFGVGARVRVAAPAAGVTRFEGTIITAGDTLAIAGDGVVVRVPVQAITRLQLGRGRSRRDGALLGARWGSGIGLVLGALTTDQAKYTTDRCAYVDRCSDASASERVRYVGLMAAGGAMWGALVGAVAGRERWDALPLGRVALQPALDAGGAPGARLVVTHPLR